MAGDHGHKSSSLLLITLRYTHYVWWQKGTRADSGHWWQKGTKVGAQKAQRSLSLLLKKWEFADCGSQCSSMALRFTHGKALYLCTDCTAFVEDD